MHDIWSDRVVELVKAAAMRWIIDRRLERPTLLFSHNRNPSSSPSPTTTPLTKTSDPSIDLQSSVQSTALDRPEAPRVQAAGMPN
jgi:hypothetical protein